MLKYEIAEVVKPNLIITLGGITIEQLLNIKKAPVLGKSIAELKTKYQDVDVIPFMHLSGSTREKKLNTFLYANKMEIRKRNKLEYADCFAKLIQQELGIK